jgi:hypothetical protein
VGVPLSAIPQEGQNLPLMKHVNFTPSTVFPATFIIALTDDNFCRIQSFAEISTSSMQEIGSTTKKSWSYLQRAWEYNSYLAPVDVMDG